MKADVLQYAVRAADGLCVERRGAGRWWPGDDLLAELEARPMDEQCDAVCEACLEHPELGEWR